MTRSRPTAALAAALALAAAACNGAKPAAPGVRLRQPSAIAAFVGRTLKDPNALRPYLAVANAARNDLAILDATDDTVVPAPIKLRGLLLPVANRPSLLVSASLGDGKADLLVAVSGGDSVLQVVETWNAANTVHSEPPLAVDLATLPGLSPGDGDVLALAAVPSDPGTARIAAALSGARVAIVEYARAADGEGIALVSSTPSAALPFQPESIAALPDDPGVAGIQTALYVATRDEVASGVRGVAEVSMDLATVRALGARAPTRLVAAARVRERRPESAASDASAFTVTSTAADLGPLVPRVYAVLDESGCGPSRPIDCGIVTLDPAAAPGAQAIPPDDAGLMPYRAPMRVPGRALALAVAGPPARPPPNVAGEPIDWGALGQQYPGAFMRLYMGTIVRATTGVAAVASDNGSVYYLDLGRFEAETSGPIVQAARGVGAPQSTFVTVAPGDERRLWVEVPPAPPPDPSTPPAPPTFPAIDSDAAKQIRVTPGFTPDESWTVSYQGTLTAANALGEGLVSRAGEAGLASAAAGTPWIALQVGAGPASGPRTFSEVVRIWDPALAVRAAVPAVTTDPPAPRVPGDILVIEAAAVPGCVGTDPPGTSASTTAPRKEFEVEVDELLAPTDAYPGGAVTVVPRRSAEDTLEWTACYGALVAAVAGGNVLGGLTVTVRATDLVLLGKSIGYAGRPPRGAKFTLGYSDEDALAAACPVSGWTGTLPAPACDAACRTSCEALVLARKARRLHHVSVDCSTSTSATAACLETWPPADYPFPLVNGPALEIYVDVQQRGSAAPAQPTRALSPLTLSTSSGVTPLASRGASTSPFGASGAIAFDRTPWVDDPAAGYRFLVSYPADFALDATPGQSGAPSTVIR